MCGIAAIFSYRGGPPVVESELLSIRDRMTSRGPDGAGVWISEDRLVGLAHRRLAIIDLSASGRSPCSMTREHSAFRSTVRSRTTASYGNSLKRKGFISDQDVTLRS